MLDKHRKFVDVAQVRLSCLSKKHRTNIKTIDPTERATVCSLSIKKVQFTSKTAKLCLLNQSIDKKTFSQQIPNFQCPRTSFQSTYDYGRQLLQATVVLCQSLRCTTRSSGDTLPRLNRVWKQFSVSAEERQQRLELAQNFHTAAEKVRPSLPPPGGGLERRYQAF